MSNENEEEVILEELDEQGDEKSLKQKINDLKVQLKEKEKEAKENLDGWARARADLANKEKQIQAEKIEIYKNAAANLLEEIIPVLDSYEMARKNKENWEKVEQNWRLGVEYIFQQLITVCENSGLKKLDVKTGDVFDVSKMSAVEEVSTDDASQDHTVSDIIQSGYELNGKLLREVKVKIFIKK
jgi:molecular chaperone GrpE